MRYLVTGGAGFIGSHLVEALVKTGRKVRVFDNLSTGKKENLASVWDKIEFEEGDLCRREDVASAVRDVEIVFHEAAIRSVPRSFENPLVCHETNTTGTLNLLLACKESSVRRLVYASSSSVYGDNRQFPQVETMRPAPLSPYAVSKLTGEQYCTVFAKTVGLDTVVLRYFNVFGPRQQPDSPYAAVIPLFMKSALAGEPLEIHSDGRQSRDFTYIDNVVQGNLLAAQCSRLGGQAINLACGENISLLQIVRELENLVGHKLEKRFHPMRTGDVRKTWADIRKAKKLLRFKPMVPFNEGLRRTWEWARTVSA